ncbi:hypothetical protein BOTBODRAFT_37764 [Botryobasidium botryosum FD-172 SS1]|uniref:Ubiquitin-like domain-containing protein n=1 Tax=Botryobasidium botryosum (strain FD-172 SS1) TaxID=930990 RepID=A0A067LYW0_BOTB1|nr:hypothetical protein BOTBODRAFT_37764 [Botryobasidium botryosum FD-172 SS1]
MASQPDETAFIKSHLGSLASVPLTYLDEYQPEADHIPKKIPVFGVELLPPPERKNEDVDMGDNITITIKSSKPAASFELSVHTTDTIAILKTKLEEQNGPPADKQRLLLKGKALLDTKLLKEYGIGNGDTVNLMVKPDYKWDPSEEKPKEPTAPAHTPGHQRIPSLVLSTTSPTSPTGGNRPPIPLTLDTNLTQAVPPQPTSAHATISSPDFWHRLRAFLWGEFAKREDADATFEAFFVASKGSISPHEIAKIRDTVGVLGMGGV